MSRPAVILLSGGLDSSTVLAIAKSQGFTPYALSFCYGQRHLAELDAAKKVAAALGVARHEIIDLDLARFGGSALTNTDIAIPTQERAVNTIPVTYVPARNTVMLSIALSWMEALGGRDLFFGANAVDYSGYPDCRPEYVHAFEHMANLATKRGVEGEKITVHAPILSMSKAQIILAGVSLGVDFSLTVSCYQADSEGYACAVCDSCRLRLAGFVQAGVIDPTRYSQSARLAMAASN
ncbi:MAG: 7-cyano-7-deazaguanine synthase QueC [Ottowia sp.]|nr:7-cyano-7-deazaguanine synthase QueC [Ottowia sp.]